MLEDGHLSYWIDEAAFSSHARPQGCINVIGADSTVVEGADDHGYMCVLAGIRCPRVCLPFCLPGVSIVSVCTFLSDALVFEQLVSQRVADWQGGNESVCSSSSSMISSSVVVEQLVSQPS